MSKNVCDCGIQRNPIRREAPIACSAPWIFLDECPKGSWEFLVKTAPFGYKNSDDTRETLAYVAMPVCLVAV